MDVLIELIFDNLIFLFVIIAGLLSFFNRLMSGTKQRDKEQAGTERSRRQDGEGTGRQTVREVMRRMQEMAESLDPETAAPERRTPKAEARRETATQTSTESTAAAPTYSFEQQRDEQFKRLQKQYESVTSDNLNTEIDMDSPIYSQAHAATSEGSTSRIAHRPKTSVNLKSRLNADGLIESVIMAEVLGPPRARKRYSNRYLER